MSLIIKVKQTTLIVSDNPVYFNTGICILIAALAFFLYQIGYTLNENSKNKAEAATGVYYDLLMKTEIDSIEPVVIDQNIVDRQWELHDSFTAVRKKNFESLFAVSNEQILINLDMPLNMKEKDLMDNVAFQAVNYAHILNKRAPSNQVKTVRIYMSEKIPMGKTIALDFDKNELLKFVIGSKLSAVGILKYAKMTDSEQVTPSMLSVKDSWCKSSRAEIPICN